jgi:acetoin utilization deacetylase AcuC-like enzyme
MRAFYCDHFVLPLPDGHRFPMSKYSGLRARVLDEDVLPPEALHEPAPATWVDLALVHTPEYLEGVACGTLSREAQRRIGFPWSPAMVERARRSVGGTIAAAHAALEDGTAVNLAGGTHHAFPDRGQGYCVFNDMAVASRVLLRDGLATRVLIVDLDVHQGDGTAAIFGGEPRVFTCSMHGAQNYPFRKERSDLDVAIEDGATDDEYLALLARHLPQVLDVHRPDFVFYLAGADPYAGDRLGRLALTIDGLRARDDFVFVSCRTRGVPVAAAMGGGYAEDVNAIVTIHANTVRAAVAAA